MMWRCICDRTPCVGLDCGVWLPGQAPRRRSAPRETPEQLAAIRAKAWQTRRLANARSKREREKADRDEAALKQALADALSQPNGPTKAEG